MKIERGIHAKFYELNFCNFDVVNFPVIHDDDKIQNAFDGMFNPMHAKDAKVQVNIHLLMNIVVTNFSSCF